VFVLYERDRAHPVSTMANAPAIAAQITVICCNVFEQKESDVNDYIIYNSAIHNPYICTSKKKHPHAKTQHLYRW
jgi:hypothetical protein